MIIETIREQSRQEEKNWYQKWSDEDLDQILKIEYSYRNIKKWKYNSNKWKDKNCKHIHNREKNGIEQQNFLRNLGVIQSYKP